jgi:hypothetical protein
MQRKSRKCLECFRMFEIDAIGLIRISKLIEIADRGWNLFEKEKLGAGSKSVNMVLRPCVKKCYLKLTRWLLGRQW